MPFSKPSTRAHRTMRVRLARTLAALLAVAPVHFVAAQAAAADEGRFVSVRGTDTLTREQFTRTATSLSGTVTRTNGGTTKYEAHLKPNGAVDRLTVTVGGGRGSGMNVQLWQRGDSVMVLQETDTTAIAARDVIPTLNTVYALYEQALRHSAAVGGSEPTVHWIRVLQPPTIVDAVVARPAADSAVMIVDKNQVLTFKLDKDGRLLRGVNAAAGLQIVRVR